MEPFLQEPNQKIDNSLFHLKKELSAIRAGRANPSLLEELSITAYGATMKLNEVGTISAPQPSLLTVQVWDNSLVKDVEKAILTANLGLNPAVDGQLVRVPIPPLTEERRQEFVKVAHTKGEECRVDIRRIRQEYREKWAKEEEDGEIGEDELGRREEMFQNLIDKSNAAVDELVKEKEAELMQV